MEVRQGVYPIVAHLKDASLRYALALLANIRQGLPVLSGTSSSLFRTFINYGRKPPCSGKAPEKLVSDEHSSLFVTASAATTENV